MKQFILLIIFSSTFAVFSVNNFRTIDLTQLIVTVPELSENELKEKLEKEFNSMSGVVGCEASLMTKTMLMKYDGRKLNSDDIRGIFKKWSCNPIDFVYQKLY